MHEGFDLGWESGEPLRDGGQRAGLGVENSVPGPGPMDGQNVWPDELQDFKDPVLEY